jgi:FdhD protein
MPDSSEIVVSSPGISRIPVQKIAAGSLRVTSDPVAIEDPLEIRIQFGPGHDRKEQSLSVTMRTPGNDEELAIGWLFTEGIIPLRLRNIQTAATPNTITLSLPEDESPDLSRSQRHSFTSSSCGVCGKTSLDSLQSAVPDHTISEFAVPASLLYALPALLREGQDIFDATGGLHAAALFSEKGRLLALREDIGRHNALDKLIGYAFQQQWLPVPPSILLLSGRACFELIQKAAMAGIRIVAAVGPPSSLAIRYAEESGITLVGFLRQQRFNIYSAAHRIHI